MASKVRLPLAERIKVGLNEAIADVRGDLALVQVDVGDKLLEPRSPQKGRKRPKWDSRLTGTWKSDRRRTFRNWQPKPGADPKAVLKFKSLFGKLTVRWGRGKYHWDLGNDRETANYEIVGTDSGSVVIRSWSTLFEEYRLQQIHFEENHYFIALGAGLLEYFRRVS